MKGTRKGTGRERKREKQTGGERENSRREKN